MLLSDIRFLANMQRDGTFSVIPKVAGGEVSTCDFHVQPLTNGIDSKDHARQTDCPGPSCADILSFNLTQANSGSFRPRKMNDPDLSTKLKLMGVDVSSPIIL